MAHPLRLRILRLCLHDALTNKEIADRLGQDPATTLHHVRTLCATGFLDARATPHRQARCAREAVPFDRKSWTLSVAAASERATSVLAGIDALRAELTDAGPDAIVINSRCGLRLSADELAELAARLDQLVEEYAARPPTAARDPTSASTSRCITLPRDHDGSERHARSTVGRWENDASPRWWAPAC